MPRIADLPAATVLALTDVIPIEQGDGVVRATTIQTLAGAFGGTGSGGTGTDLAVAAETARAESVEAAIASVANAALPRAGGTMGGAIVLAGDPTSALHPVTLQYFEEHVVSAVVSGGSTSAYTLPAATSGTLGGVEVGAGISVTSGGVISVSTAYDVAGSAAAEAARAQAAEGALSSAITSAVAVEKTRAQAAESTISGMIATVSGGGAAYVLPAATSATLGGVKQGANVTIAGDGTLSVAAPPAAYTLSAATAATLGGVKPGTGVAVAGDGTISVSTAYDAAGAAAAEATRAETAESTISALAAAALPKAGGTMGGAIVLAGDPTSALHPVTLQYLQSHTSTYALPTATSSGMGGVEIGAGISVTSGGVISVSTAYDAAGAAAAEQTRAQAVESTISGIAAAALPKSGGNLTGPLLLQADPVADLGATTKQYVDNKVATVAGGGASYTLPAATQTILGGVKVGSGVSVTADGTVSVSTAYDAAGAAATVSGTLQPEVTSAQSTANTASATAAAALPKSGGTMGGALILAADPVNALGAVTKQYADSKAYTLSAATTSSLGGVQVGSGLAVTSGGLLSLSYSYTLPAATSAALGGVKQGANVAIAADGTLSVAAPTPAYTLPAATSGTLGGVEVGAGISVTSGGVISVSTAYDAAGSAATEQTRAQTAEASITSAVTSAQSTANTASGTATSAQSTANTASAAVAAITAATTSKLGLVEVGAGISVTSGGVISVSTAYDPQGAAATETARAESAEGALTSAVTSAQSTANAASAGVAAITAATGSKLGLVEVGAGISVTSGGVISVATNYDPAGTAAAAVAAIPAATTSAVGLVEVGAGISVTSGGVISVSTAYDPAGAAATVSSTLSAAVYSERTRAQAAESTNSGATVSAQNTANTASATAAAALPTSGGTMTGPLVLSGNPTSASQASNKGYVDSAVAAIPTYSLSAATSSGLGGVEIGAGISVTSGGVISVSTAYDPAGAAATVSSTLAPLVTSAQSTANTASATAAAALPKAGGTLSGALVLAGDPTSALNPVTLQYLQSHTSTYTLPTATSSGIGGVEIGAGISVTSGGVISVSTAYDAAGAAATVSSTLAPLVTSAQSTANTASATAAAALPKAGGTLSGALVLAGDPTSALNPVTLQYLQSHTSTYTLPVATSSGVGGVEVGSGISVTSGGIISVPVAAVGTLGEVSVVSGGGLAITSSGGLSVNVGSGLVISGGALTVSGGSVATVDALGNTTSTTTTLNLANGVVQTLTINCTTQLAITGWGNSGTVSELVLELFEGGSATYALTWPAISWVGAGGVIAAGTTGAAIPAAATNSTGLQASATSPDFIYLWTFNAGSTIYGKVMR